MHLLAAAPPHRRPIVGAAALLCAFLALALSAALARATPPDPPALTETNPASPSASWQEFALQPFVRGNVEGIVISGLGHGGGGPGPLAMAGGPQDQVAIYDDGAACQAGESEAAVGEGTAGELKEPGIQVAPGVVGPDSETTFYATVTDAVTEETSQCSDPFTYRQVSTPPDAPEFTQTVPASPANDNDPWLVGSADPQATVSIYASASCASGHFPSGGPLATGSGAQFAAGGIQASVPDNSTTTFAAVATLAGFSSVCSSSTITYVEETPEGPGEGGGGGGGEPTSPAQPQPASDPPGAPPAPKLRTTPEGTANDNAPSITGKAPGAALVQIFGSAGCGGPILAQGSVAQFSDGLPVQVADNTKSSFYGVAIDAGGDRSPCTPDPVEYVEDSTAPETRITSGPGAKTRKRKVSFRFADVSEDLSAHFICRLDRRRWRSCSSPLRLRHLGRRRHLLRVKAIDAAGNREKKATKRRFRVVRR